MYHRFLNLLLRWFFLALMLYVQIFVIFMGIELTIDALTHFVYPIQLEIRIVQAVSLGVTSALFIALIMVVFLIYAIVSLWLLLRGTNPFNQIDLQQSDPDAILAHIERIVILAGSTALIRLIPVIGKRWVQWVKTYILNEYGRKDNVN